MYAIVEIAGQQYKVEEGKKIFVHRMEAAEGENVEFEKVLLIDNDGVITIGEPVIENTVVEGKVLSHPRGDKVIIFKKKRRKGYQKRSGHRQDLTQVEILSIGARGEAKKKSPAKAKVKVKAEAEAEVEVEGKAEVKAETKKAPAKKVAAPKEKTEKKTAEKKAPASKSVKKPAKE
jgi:large subunit ribosomal protein L21